MTAVTAPPSAQNTSLAYRVRPDEARKGWRHQDAVALLRRLIEIGELSPGERLRELAISEKLGMSRTPVREPFRTLAAEGLVELLPKRSVIVSDVDRSELRDVFLVLGKLKGLAAQQACERITDDEGALLGTLQEELERYYGMADRANYVEVNRRIHEVSVEASRNAPLMAEWRRILPRADRGRNTNNINRNRWTGAVYEHRMTYSAIAGRDAGRIVSLMNDHLRNGLASAERASEAKSAADAKAQPEAPSQP
jgi:DNA-binding GntR family transcriptional regulator